MDMPFLYPAVVFVVLIPFALLVAALPLVTLRDIYDWRRRDEPARYPPLPRPFALTARVTSRCRNVDGARDISYPGSRSASAARMAWTAIPAVRPVRNSPEKPITIASARPSACRGTISP